MRSKIEHKKNTRSRLHQFNLHRDTARNRYRCRYCHSTPSVHQATTFKFIFSNTVVARGESDYVFHIIIINPTISNVTYLVIFVPFHLR